jgi:hypothetical protein
MYRVLYKPVKLEADKGELQYQCWLPLKYAKLGNQVRITDYPHTLWSVSQVYDLILDGVSLRDLGEEHRYHRRVTDI